MNKEWQRIAIEKQLTAWLGADKNNIIKMLTNKSGIKWISRKKKKDYFELIPVVVWAQPRRLKSNECHRVVPYTVALVLGYKKLSHLVAAVNRSSTRNE